VAASSPISPTSAVSTKNFMIRLPYMHDVTGSLTRILWARIRSCASQPLDRQSAPR
jgi:hypothetical protein